MELEEEGVGEDKGGGGEGYLSLRTLPRNNYEFGSKPENAIM